jgi:hypothetical protein
MSSEHENEFGGGDKPEEQLLAEYNAHDTAQAKDKKSSLSSGSGWITWLLALLIKGKSI